MVTKLILLWKMKLKDVFIAKERVSKNVSNVMVMVHLSVKYVKEGSKSNVTLS